MSNYCNPLTVACQAPLSMGFSRQEYWSGLPFLSPGFICVVSIIPHQWHFQGKKYWDVSSITHSNFSLVCILLNITVGLILYLKVLENMIFFLLKTQNVAFCLYLRKKTWIHLLVRFVSLISLFVVLIKNHNSSETHNLDAHHTSIRITLVFTLQTLGIY